MWKIIFTIISLICFVIFYILGKRSAVQERAKENIEIEKHNQELEQENIKQQNRLEELNQACAQVEKKISTAKSNAEQEYNKLINDLTIQYKNTEADYALRAAEMSHNLDYVKDNKFSNINRAATKYREKLYKEIQQDITAAAAELENNKKQLEQSKVVLMGEIDELKSSRDALIEANRREEELKLQQDFYKIVLTPQDFSDIKLLKSIEQHLYNKEPLYKLIWNQFYMTPTKIMLNRIIGKDKTSGIYKITNQINGKVYIGQSVDLHSRLTNHIKAAIGIGNIAHQLVHDAMAADGIENFTFEIVEKCSKEQLNKKEKLWIETYSSDKYGYNRTAGGSKEEKD